MDYNQTLDFLYHKLPAFQRIGGAAYKDNLDNTIALDNELGSPHKNFKTIHVAGTNGKGSTSAMIAGALMQAGYRTGLYTSPHLSDFRERITVDSQMMPREEVVRFVEQHREVIERIEPSFFEVTVAMAFDYFRRAEVDVAVIEVGMGGRLDSTNIITPLLSVITNIDFDHMQFLGDTLPKIAGEKAGIIKEGIPLVVGETTPETATIFIERAHSLGAPICFADQRYRCTQQEDSLFTIANLLEGGSFTLTLGMEGEYQRRNICTALAALDQLSSQLTITADHVRRAMEQTTVRGRWQKLSDRPLTICDTGHNKAGLEYVVRQIERQSYDKLYFVLGVVSDKDLDAMFTQLPHQAYYLFTQADIPRAMDCHLLAQRAKQAGFRGETITTVQSALARARELATEQDMIFVGGSTFTVAEVV